ncbi:MAG: SEC-C domain-containing protein [Candidatus Obscuribacterales bacterium]
MKKPFPPNNYCPCGSNIKYKSCCRAKGIDYFIKNKKVIREAAMSQERREQFERDKKLFQEKFGRKPTDEEEGILRADGFADLTQLIESEMLKSGMSEEMLYAYRQTGLVITAENRSSVRPDELARWDAAIDDYRKQG